jgi:hypothetical protein
MDDWRRSATELPPAADKALAAALDRIAPIFLKDEVLPFLPPTEA